MRHRWGGFVSPVTCPGSSGSLGSLSFMLQVRGRHLLALVSL